MNLSRALWATLILTIVIMGSASAQNCNDLMKELQLPPEGLADGATYVQVPKSYVAPDGTIRRSKTKMSWEPLGSVTSAGLSAPTPGLTVVRDLIGRERIGVLVVKTGRFGPISNEHADEVSLIRQSKSSCASPISKGVTVAAEVYDGFHDFGRQNFRSEELQRLNKFHVAFGKDCKQRTDDDPGGFNRHVSNRASFSFTPDVVDTGGYTGFEATAAKLGFGRVAEAQRARKEVGYSERKAEIISYETTVGLACIPVTIPASTAGNFFRSNDLAGPFVSDVREKRH